VLGRFSSPLNNQSWSKKQVGKLFALREVVFEATSTWGTTLSTDSASPGIKPENNSSSCRTVKAQRADTGYVMMS